MNPALAQEAVDRIFASRLAAPATYTAPDGTVTACRIMVHRRGRLATGARPISFQGTRLEIAAASADVLVRVSEIAAPAPEGRFAITGTPLSYTVGADPLAEDVLGLVWRCECSEPDIG